MSPQRPVAVLLVERASVPLDGELLRALALLDGRAVVRVVDSLESHFVPVRANATRRPSRRNGRPRRPAILLASWLERSPPAGTLADRAVRLIPGLSGLSVKHLARDLGVSTRTLERGFEAAGSLPPKVHLWAYTEALVRVCHSAGWTLEDTVQAADFANGSVLRRAFRHRGVPFPRPWLLSHRVRAVSQTVASLPALHPARSRRRPGRTTRRDPGMAATREREAR